MIIRIRIPMLPIARKTRNIEVVPTPAPSKIGRGGALTKLVDNVVIMLFIILF